MAEVFLYVPHVGHTIWGVTASILDGLQGAQHRLHVRGNAFGALTHNFNMGWAAAYNTRKATGITHWAMMHSDIWTVERWCNILLDEMDRTGADVLSVAVALGDTRGLSSTGVVRHGERDVRRLSFKEIYDLPETFSIADLPEAKTHIMVVNTGLWIMRFDPELWKKFHGFQIENRMLYEPDRDHLQAQFYSEDWLFSEWAAFMGLKVMCTRKVEATHFKLTGYGNGQVWGCEEYDQEFCTLRASGEEGHLGGSTRPTAITPHGDRASWCPPVWDDLIAHEGIASVLDVGCGCGFSAKYFEQHGCDVLGIDGDANALQFYRGKTAIKHDFTRGPAHIDRDYDLVWCSEFVEHVDSKYETFFLDALAHGKIIAMTHALPNQTGTHHVNCQESEYWIKRIEGLGYRYDPDTTEMLRNLVNHGSTEGLFFARTGLIFRKVAV